MRICLRRREFTTLLGGAAAWPLAARAQQPALPVIGLLGGVSAAEGVDPLPPGFRRGLSETGYVEGRNVAFEYRWAEGEYGRFPMIDARCETMNASPGTTKPPPGSRRAAASWPLAARAQQGDPWATDIAATGNARSPSEQAPPASAPTATFQNGQATHGRSGLRLVRSDLCPRIGGCFEARQA